MRTDELLASYGAALSALVAHNRRVALEEHSPGQDAFAAAARAVVDAREAIAVHLDALPTGERAKAMAALRSMDQQGERSAGLLVAANPYRRAAGQTGWWWTARAECPETLLTLPSLAEIPAEVATHARSCTDCADAVLRARTLRGLVGPRAPQPTRMKGWLAWGLGGSLATASAVGLVLLLAPTRQATPVLLERGGDPSLTVYAIRKGRSVRVEPGRRLFVDDTLRLEEVAAGWPYLLVLATREQGGANVVLFPRSLGREGSGSGAQSRPPAVEIPSGGLGPVLGSIRLVAVWSAQPVRGPAVLQALATGQPLPGRSLILPYTVEAP